MQEINDIVVVGAGSAGLLSALTLKRAFPPVNVQILYSPDVPVIGVGESTTAIFPPFLHSSLGIDFNEFFSEVRASWKLGVRFEWGDPNDSHFNYPFDSSMSTKSPQLRKMPPYYCIDDWTDASRNCTLMDQKLSPCFRDQNGRLGLIDAFGYHIENRAFISFLEKKAQQSGITLTPGEIEGARRNEEGNIADLQLKHGGSITADLFVDCSGFRAQLILKSLQESFVSYEETLFCDRAIIGHWPRHESDGDVLPYTTTETMDHGWCWRIDFPDHVTRGYVFSSAFCSDDEAVAEFLAKNPQLSDDLRCVPFRSGRYQNFWRGNVIAIGNASGFVEPLEATALHLLVEQIRLVCRCLSESDLRLFPNMEELANDRYRLLWDEVRDFLAVHYRFNRKCDTPFWQHCRNETDLGGAAEFVQHYQQFGPSTLCTSTLPSGHVFGYDGFMALLIGQRVPTAYRPKLSASELATWRDFRNRSQQIAQQHLPMLEAFRQIQR